MTVLIVGAEREANSTVGTIRRKIVNRVNDTIMMLYKCIGHILEYCIHVQALSGTHYHKLDMDKLTKVRTRAIDVLIEYLYSTLPGNYRPTQRRFSLDSQG